ncbi:hypothetical protein M426DRAFT_11646 [Hypoxylon sp. CI-4A]|nr:hypothetical protein M426DRAFT_11646 [Hypoxylon sp. CI-4A]
MHNTAARALLRQSLARPELGRVRNVARQVYSSKQQQQQPQCLRPTTPAAAAAAAACTLLQNTAVVAENIRAFHTTPLRSKGKSREPGWSNPKQKIKEDRKKRESEASASAAAASSRAAEGDHDDDSSSSGPKHPQPNPEEPLDFADVESRLRRHDEHFRELLKKLKTGGRFNPDVVGSLRVVPDRKRRPDASYPLRDVAQVIPRGGRTISVLAHEEAYVKAIMSAVQASPDFNQQPQRDPDNELELVLKIEPERRDDLVRRVKAACNEWRDRVRSVRQKRDKLHATWKKDGALGPDAKRTADKELDKVIKSKMGEIDDAEKDALKAAETK